MRTRLQQRTHWPGRLLPLPIPHSPSMHRTINGWDKSHPRDHVDSQRQAYHSHITSTRRWISSRNNRSALQMIRNNGFLPRRVPNSNAGLIISRPLRIRALWLSAQSPLPELHAWIESAYFRYEMRVKNRGTVTDVPSHACNGCRSRKQWVDDGLPCLGCWKAESDCCCEDHRSSSDRTALL